MTKEERQKYKELTKALPKMLKDKIKKYKFKKKDFMIWYSKKELFFDLLINAKVKSDDKCYCTAIETIKPLWLDDLLWDLLKMETNKEEPLSLRAVGAFTVSGAELFKNETELKEWKISELEEIVDNYLAHFYKTIQSSSICDFYNNCYNSIYHVELRKALLIHEHKYQDALDYLKDKGEGIFKNGDVAINNAIREYCINQLSN